MKKLAAMLMLATALVAPAVAMARDVTIETSLVQYSGHAAYLAVYLTNPDGSYNSTLWVSGQKSKYYGDLRGWARAASSAGSLNLDGITGASVGAGRTLEITLDLADALFDAGYTLHIDAAVEDMRDSPNEIAVPLTAAGADTPVQGRRYISSFVYQ